MYLILVNRPINGVLYLFNVLGLKKKKKKKKFHFNFRVTTTEILVALRKADPSQPLCLSELLLSLFLPVIHRRVPVKRQILLKSLPRVLRRHRVQSSSAAVLTATTGRVFQL